MRTTNHHLTVTRTKLPSARTPTKSTLHLHEASHTRNPSRDYDIMTKWTMWRARCFCDIDEFRWWPDKNYSKIHLRKVRQQPRQHWEKTPWTNIMLISSAALLHSFYWSKLRKVVVIARYLVCIWWSTWWIGANTHLHSNSNIRRSKRYGSSPQWMGAVQLYC